MRGILYSIIAALLVIPVFGLILFNSQLIEKNVDVNIRSNELEYFSISVEEDMVRFLKIAGRRALISAVSNVITNGVPLTDAQANLSEMIMNGTLGGVVAPLIGDDNFNSWRENVMNIAASSGFDLDFQNYKVNITQNDSYNVLFKLSTVLNISDANLDMGIEKNLIASIAVSIDGIEDPLFPLKTYSRVIRIIYVSNLTNYSRALVQGTTVSGSISGNATKLATPSIQKIFVTSDMGAYSKDFLNQFAGVVSESGNVPSGVTVPYIANAAGALTSIQENERIFLDQTSQKVWDLQNLTLFVKNKYYESSTNGPSFLDRLEGRLSLSSKYGYGLESFVNLDELSSAGLGVNYQYSCVDYLYWSSTSGSSIRNGNYDNIFSWLKIDSNHANIYGVNELI